ncbi:MAG: PilT/PilU family type 4a pilus ATPase [Actinobacteria bacterium]|nr:PilT/PilU family type 4a pilus ATPase [Actinomycetota bacterium]MDQ3533301.1 PilT/PilU family type 4a pilus ATPase [Actinomycetota bacterium]
MADIHDLLRFVVEHRGSDLHIQPDAAPSVRIDGSLVGSGFPSMTESDCTQLAKAMMSEDQAAELGRTGEVDFAYSESRAGRRFRVNVYRQLSGLGIAARLLPPVPFSFEALALPDAVKGLAEHQRGLLLLTGPTSAGKTTTAAAMINHINMTRPCHILTIEDPIEILHRNGRAVVSQREVGQSTADFATGIRAAMRQDPDVIFVGEIRDAETVKAALQVAETGHLVIATLHTTDVAETINRVIEFFPMNQQEQVRVALAGATVGVVSQRLLPKVGGGRVPAVEVMVMNGRTRDLILKGRETHQLHDVIAKSAFYGMQTFDQALLKLYRARLIELEDAKRAASNPHDLHLALQQEGLQPVS